MLSSVRRHSDAENYKRKKNKREEKEGKKIKPTMQKLLSGSNRITEKRKS